MGSPSSQRTLFSRRTSFLSPFFSNLSFILLALAAIWTSGCNKTTQIGVVLPLTGDYEAYGQSSLRGIELALEAWQAQAGSEATISLDVRDSESSPERASQLLDELFQNGAFATLGGLTSSEAARMIPIADRHERVLLSPWASSAELPRRSAFFYRLAPSDFVAGNKIADFATRELRIREAVIAASDEALGDSAIEGFRSTFEKQFGNVEATVRFSSTDDLSQVAQAMASHSPDAVFIVAYDKTIVELVKALRQGGFRGQILTTQALASRQSRAALGIDAEGVVLTRVKLEVEESVGKAFLESYQQAHSGTPDIFAAQGYDALRVLLSAVEDARGLPSKVRDGLRDAVREFPGVTGSLQFNDHGEIALYPKVFLVDKGHLVDYQSLLLEREEQRRKEREEVRRRLARLRQEMGTSSF